MNLLHLILPDRLKTSERSQSPGPSIVMALIIELFSADRDISTCSWIILLQEKCKNEHD
jgi:hypothetical protein